MLPNVSRRDVMRPDQPALTERRVAAAEAMPVEAGARAAKARTQRRLSSVAVVVAAFAAAACAPSSGDGGGPQGPPSVSSTPSAPAAPVSATTALFVCGQSLQAVDAASTRSGLTMAVGSVRRVADDAGPDLTVTFTAASRLHVMSSPPRLFEVVYLRDGIIVGGGPMLNPPGDASPQGQDLPGYGFEVGPDRPASLALGPRPALCPPLSWPQVWSTPQSFEVMVVQGKVEIADGRASLNVPAPGFPLLLARAGLPLG
jgi:hypothetical protein